MTNKIFLQSNGPDDLKVILEDDGRVAYAYLLIKDQIKGDVWLYNRGDAPLQPEWDNQDKAPYANPVSFAHKLADPLKNASEVEIRWRNEKESLPEALIYLRSDLFAVLRVGSKPGWSKLAKQDGPLALVLKETGAIG
jgi:hypothetical protein